MLERPLGRQTTQGQITINNITDINKNKHSLMTAELRSKLPELYATENDKDPVIWAHFTAPASGWDWYVTEFDGQDRLFGYVVGFEAELGYFSLSELESVTNGCGDTSPAIKLDADWKPLPISEIRAN